MIGQIDKRIKYTLKSDYFEKVDGFTKAYILGFIFSDGNMRNKIKHIGIKITDTDLLESIKDELGYNGKLSEEIREPKYKNIKKLTICNAQMYNDLINLGCLPNKTYNNRFPDLDSKYVPAFIHGFFDGNGSIYVGADKRNGSLVGEMVICSTTSFCEKLKEYFDSVKIHSVLFRDNNHDERIGKIRIRRMEDLFNFYNLLYKIEYENPIFLKRKYNKFSKYIQMQFGENYVIDIT